MYNDIFSRNIGVISEKEQIILKKSKVAIAGLGGVGGNVANILARAGIGSFKLAEFDKFDISNINRQNGANIRTIGKSKIDIVADNLRDINPKVKLELFKNGLTTNNIEQFKKNTNYIVDAIDFTSLDLRYMLYHKAQSSANIYLCPALGFGISMIIFGPGGIKFKDFIGEKNEKNNKELMLRFARQVFSHIPDYIDREKYLLGINEKDYLPTFSSSVILASVMVANEIIINILGKRNPKLFPFVYRIDLLEQFR